MKKRLIIIIAAIVLVVAVAVTTTIVVINSQDSSSSQSSIEEKTSYTVTFNTNGGAEIAPASVTVGESIDLSNYQTTKENYYFYSWCTDAELTNRCSKDFTPESDCVLYAEWGEEEKYLLVFETGEGSEIQSVLYSPNAYLAEPEEPTRENYVFAGWYKDAEFTRLFNFFGNTMPKREVTVYAKWNPLYAIHFNSNGGSEVASLTGEVGDLVDAPEAPVKEGFVFEGWFESLEESTPYEITEIPEESITLYAKWHEQQKNIQIVLHSNCDYFGVSGKTVTVTADEGDDIGELPKMTETQADFTSFINGQLKDYFIDKTVDLESRPVLNFSGWALNESGSKTFDGIVPATEDAVHVYATWVRSTVYCEVKFVATEEGESDIKYIVVKNSVIDDSIIENIETPLQEKYEPLGCMVDGFYTTSGLRYVAGQNVVMDMELSPYLYSLDLVYEYGSAYTASGSTVNGYMVKGYDPESTLVTKDSEGLILKIPEYYDDGVNGSAPVLWILEGAFKDYDITEVSLSKRLLGLSNEAFRNTSIKKITIPTSVYELDDYVFADCANLAEVEFKGSTLSWIGTKIYLNTPYENTLPTDKDGFVFFNDDLNIIYGYKGTEAEITTPDYANVLAGGAFKGDTTVKKLTLSDNMRFACSNAFEGSALEEVHIGKSFGVIGEYVFKDCVNLKKITFSEESQMTYTGHGMFQGCTALEEIDFSSVVFLQLINSYTFYDCNLLKTVKLSSGVYTAQGVTSYFAGAGKYAFANCTSLQTVNFPTSLQLIDEHCFENSAISTVSVGSSLASIGKYAFANCDNLVGINFRGLTLITTIEEGLFYDCDSLLSVSISDFVTEIKASAFENCDKLLYVNCGTTADSQLVKIGDRAFAECKSLRKIVIFSALKSDQPVSFGKNLFDNTGYTLDDGNFRTTVIYVKAGAPDFSATSKWKDPNGKFMYSYVEIYQRSFKNTEYADMTVKKIDTEIPKLTLTQDVLHMISSEELKAFDLMAYFKEQDLFTVSDNDSLTENCDVVISEVAHNANGEQKTVKETDGKYDISALGTYAVTITASDEYGNSTSVTLQIVVSAQ